MSMRKIVVYPMILIYCMAVLNPILPVLKDWTAHIFFHHHHITTFHHHMGHDHVIEEIIISSQDPFVVNENKSTLVSEKLDLHYKSDITEIFFKYFLVKQTIFLMSNFQLK